ncbi:MAG: NAD-dependent epimerase/dehydratase family protein [Chlamydiota bacterium]
MKIIKLFLFLIPMLGSCDTFLVFGGKTGWIGQKLVVLLEDLNHNVISANARLENREEVIREIEQVLPDFIINAAGVTGRPNVDWCEGYPQETIRANLIGALNLADIAFLKGIHLTQFGTGCIYEYDDGHPLGSGIGFKEEDEPNFEGSFYSRTKGMLDKLLQSYPNVLNLRLRMPISTDLHPRNFITKITRYEYVVNIPNSVTVLDDLLPISIEMALKGLTGVYNFTNPGAISHNEILALYKKYVDPYFTWKNFTIEDQDKILKSKRSNNELDVTKLLNEFPQIPSVHESLLQVFEELLPKEGDSPLR